MRLIAEERQRSMTQLVLRDRALEGISQGITIADHMVAGTPIIYTNPAYEALTQFPMGEIMAGRRCRSSMLPICLALRSISRGTRARGKPAGLKSGSNGRTVRRSCAAWW